MTELRVVLPDQLDRGVVRALDASETGVLVAECGYLFGERTHLRKLALLLAAGRHFVADLRACGYRVVHRTVGARSHERALGDHIADAARELRVERLSVLRPGSWSELDEVEHAAAATGLPLSVVEDPHFYVTPAGFAEHARGRKRLVMEYFYREVRRRERILVDGDGPSGGEWNYDSRNRDAFGSNGPGDVPPVARFPPDETTSVAIDDAKQAFPGAPGSAEGFALPVTPGDASAALDDFVGQRLASFGSFQDAMWAGSPFLYHSLLASSLNLRLLDPRDAVSRAEAAYATGRAPINAAEGFIRQIAGWREFVRGVYYHEGRGYVERNELGARAQLPAFYWTGRTRMRCVRDVMEGVLRHGYAHHIQRLMVMGLFAMLYGCDPAEVHAWHLGLYVDAFDWVSAPNVVGMSQYADGGLLATKPYAASGKYLDRMSNYCRECPFRPDRAVGTDACPFTTLYWDFLARNRNAVAGNRRMRLQLANLDRKPAGELRAIRERAAHLREEGIA